MQIGQQSLEQSTFAAARFPDDHRNGPALKRHIQFLQRRDLSLIIPRKRGILARNHWAITLGIGRVVGLELERIRIDLIGG